MQGPTFIKHTPTSIDLNIKFIPGEKVLNTDTGKCYIADMNGDLIEMHEYKCCMNCTFYDNGTCTELLDKNNNPLHVTDDFECGFFIFKQTVS